MPRLLACLGLLTGLALAALGCGFGLADDTGKPIPSDHWTWGCPDGGAPAPDSGCPGRDAGGD